jgi:hypothetical protein
MKVEGLSLHGVCMRAVATSGTSVVSGDTVLEFEQVDDVVSARYRGGKIVDGYLIGLISGTNLKFRYVQADIEGHLDAGVSDCLIERTSRGLVLTEHYQWATRSESGTNVFEEL